MAVPAADAPIAERIKFVQYVGAVNGWSAEKIQAEIVGVIKSAPLGERLKFAQFTATANGKDPVAASKAVLDAATPEERKQFEAYITAANKPPTDAALEQLLAGYDYQAGEAEELRRMAEERIKASFLPQYEQLAMLGEQARQGIGHNMEARGMWRSGERLRRLAEQRAREAAEKAGLSAQEASQIAQAAETKRSALSGIEMGRAVAQSQFAGREEQRKVEAEREQKLREQAGLA